MWVEICALYYGYNNKLLGINLILDLLRIIVDSPIGFMIHLHTVSWFGKHVSMGFTLWSRSQL